MMRWPAFLFAVLLALLVAAPLHAAGGPDFAAIDAYIEQELKRSGLPGMALAIVKDGQVVHVRGFGRAHPNGDPVTPETPFLIGSLTKSFTALAVMQLAEAGLLELDAPVRRYLPEVALEGITLRHLLAHTSGIPTAAGLPMMTGDGTGSIDELVGSFASVEAAATAGELWQYSNVNYVLLGAVVERVSGQAYEPYIRQRILAPLAMNQSTLQTENARSLGAATGHRVWFGMPVESRLPHLPDAAPAGYLYASASDLANYAIAQLDEGRYGGGAVLSPAGIAELHRPVSPAFPGSEMHYGLGWIIGPVAGRPAVWHGGDNFDFHTEFVLLPEDGWGVVLLTNANHVLLAGPMLMKVRDGVIAMLYGEQPPRSAQLYQGFYLILDALLLGVLAWQVLALTRLRQWRERWAGRRWVSALQIAVGLALPPLLLLVPRVVGAPWPVILLAVPDLGWALLIVGGLMLVVAVARIGAAVVGAGTRVGRSSSCTASSDEC